MECYNCQESKTCPGDSQITRNFGTRPADLTPAQILYADSTDYLLDGSLILKNGKIEKCLFDGGYALAKPTSSTTDKFPIYYYNQDHLGNNREVESKLGTVVQVTNYYPFGAPFVENSSYSNPDRQPYKYNGKELDLMHGLNTYDYGARQYDPILMKWDRVDPLAEKYYPYNPYTYCLNSPVRNYDPDGKAVETGWDIFNVGLDITSLSHNVKNGNIGAAVVDGFCLIADVTATALPLLPGGAGAAVNTYRAGRVAHATETAIKATKHNYRKALQRATGKSGKGYEAHHTLPQKWRKRFEELGINIDEPGNVVWRETKEHRKNSKKLTSEWDKYMRKNRTKKQVLKKRDELEKKYFANNGE